MSWSIVVKPQERRFGVYVRVNDKPDELLEGGFWRRDAAEIARRRWEREVTQAEVEKAERAAGWDPNP